MPITQHQQLAREAIKHGDMNAAATAFDELTRLEPDNIEFCLMAAELNEQIGHAETAAAHYVQAARFYIKQKNIGQTMLMMKHYQRLRPDEQRLCRQLFDCVEDCEDDISPCLSLLLGDGTMKHSLRQHDLFVLISDHAFDELLPHIQIRHYADGEIITRHGDPAEALYLIAKGGVQPHVQDYVQNYDLLPIEEGGICGEVPFLTGCEERTADLIAIGKTVLAVVPYKILHELTANYPKIRQQLDRFYHTHVLERQLTVMPFFDMLTQEQRMELVPQLETLHVRGGDYVFQQNERSPLDLYIVRSGWVAVNVAIHEREHLIYTARGGSVLGEVGIVEQTRGYSARAVAETIVMRWPEEKYRAFYEQHEELRYRVADRMLAYQRAIDDLRQGKKPALSLDALNSQALLLNMYDHW